MTAKTPRRYDYLRYNRFGVLRPNWLFWIVTVFLSRHLLLFFLLGVSHGRGGGGPPNPAVAALIDPVFFISDILALVVLAALGGRLPGGGGAMRFLWRNGRLLLAGSCLLYLGLLVWRQGMNIAAWHAVTWGMIALTALVMAVLARSRYLGDLFAGFPEPEPEADSEK